MLHSENGSPNPLCYHQNLILFDLVMALMSVHCPTYIALAVREVTSLTGGNTSPLSARPPPQQRSRPRECPCHSLRNLWGGTLNEGTRGLGK